MNFVDVKGVGKPSAFQNDESKFHEWAKKLEDHLIGVEPQLEVILDWAVETEIEIIQSMIADKRGENAHTAEQVDGCAQAVVQLKIVLAHGRRKLVDRNGLEAWSGVHKRLDPLAGGGRRHMLRAIAAPQRAKMEDLGSALQTWEDMVDRCNKKNAKVGEVELADDIKCSAVESTVSENLERQLQLNARRLKKYDDVRFEIYAYFESRTGKIAKPRTRHPRQVLATIRWTPTLWSKANPMSKAKRKVK